MNTALAGVSAAAVPVGDGATLPEAVDETLPSPYGGLSLRLGGHLTLTEGNSSTRVYGVTLHADHEAARWFLGVEGSARYGKSRRVALLPSPDAETEAGRAGRPGGAFEQHLNDWLISSKYGRYLSPRRTDYLYGFGLVESDPFRGLWLRYQTQAGFGRRVATQRLSLKSEFGLDLTEDRQVDGGVRSRMAFAVNALIDYEVNENLGIRQNLSHIRTVFSNDNAWQSSGDHRTRSATHVTAKLTNRFDLQTSALWEYASQPAPGAHKSDVRLTTALIYSFI